MVVPSFNQLFGINDYCDSTTLQLHERRAGSAFKLLTEERI